MRVAAVTFIMLVFAAACGGKSGESGSTVTPTSFSSSVANAQLIEEDPSLSLPGQYVNLPLAFAVGGTLAHYEANNGASTSSHVTHDVDYSGEGSPPAGGPHWASTTCGVDPATAPPLCGPAPWGVFRSSWRPETLVENMEQGGVVIWYNTSDESVAVKLEVEAVKYLKQGDHVVVAPYSNMPSETVALTAWSRRDEFPAGELTTERIDNFVESLTCRFDPYGLCHPAGSIYRGVTLADDGRTISLHVGQGIDLNLDGSFDWTVTVEDPSVVSSVSGSPSYAAHTLGRTTLSAIGDPGCRKATPACAAPSRKFSVTIVVF